MEGKGCLNIPGDLESREEPPVLGRAYEEGLTRARLAPEGRQAVALGAGLRSNCSLHAG